MKFKNETSERIKFALRGNAPDWITVRPGEEIELSDVNDNLNRARLHGLKSSEEPEVKATESSIADNKVETKRIEPKPKPKKRRARK